MVLCSFIMITHGDKCTIHTLLFQTHSYPTSNPRTYSVVELVKSHSRLHFFPLSISVVILIICILRTYARYGKSTSRNRSKNKSKKSNTWTLLPRFTANRHRHTRSNTCCRWSSLPGAPSSSSCGSGETQAKPAAMFSSFSDSSLLVIQYHISCAGGEPMT